MGVMPIPCPHFKITIVKRSQGQSAVAGAAYQSGERLFSEYDQKTKFYNKKKELVHAEIMLPSHAPPGYADRATLWNAVEAVENQWNSQLARRIVLAFPVEVPKEQYLSMIKEFCQEQFVSKGMIADFAMQLMWEPSYSRGRVLLKSSLYFFTSRVRRCGSFQTHPAKASLMACCFCWARVVSF